MASLRAGDRTLVTAPRSLLLLLSPVILCVFVLACSSAQSWLETSSSLLRNKFLHSRPPSPCQLAQRQARLDDRSSIVQAVGACRSTTLLAPQLPKNDSSEWQVLHGPLLSSSVWAYPKPLGLCDYGPVGSSARKEVESRLIIAIGCGVSTRGMTVRYSSELPLVKTLVASFLPTAQSYYHYRFYFAYDYNDPILSKPQWRDSVSRNIAAMVAAEDSMRWHPTGYTHKATVDPSALMVSVHWVYCNYSGKPSWAHSDAITAAIKDGADYAMRVNDDTSMPSTPDWLEAFILDLRNRQPVANLGVVGPRCDNGNTAILTHDFVHRTHVCMMGFHYPRSLPDWSSDDWIDHVYRRYNLSSMLKNVTVIHQLLPTRYNVTNATERNAILWQEVNKGVAIVKQSASQLYGVELIS